jgi:hypothetical protein
MTVLFENVPEMLIGNLSPRDSRTIIAKFVFILVGALKGSTSIVIGRENKLTPEVVSPTATSCFRPTTSFGIVREKLNGGAV